MSKELRDQEAALQQKTDVSSRGRHEQADIAIKAFEFSQRISEK